MGKGTNDIIRDLFFCIILLIYGYLTLYQLPQLFLFAGGGIENEVNLWKFTIYTGMGTFAILYIILLKVFRWIFKNNSSLGWVNSIGHDPEDSPFGKVPVFKTILNNLVLTYLFAVMIFLPVSIGASLQKENTFFPDTILPNLENQVTPTAELGLSAYPASTAETLFLSVTIAIMVLLISYLQFTNVIDNVIASVLTLGIIPILGTAIWILYHIARYGTSDTALISVGLFGFISTMLIVLFRSVIMALVYHDINNFVKKAFQLFGSDQLLITLGTIEVAVIVLFIYLFVVNYLKPAKEQEVVQFAPV